MAIAQSTSTAGLPGIQPAVLPDSLGMYEECAEAVAGVVLKLL